MTTCEHSILPESRTKPDRFVRSNATVTLEEALNLPVNLSRMPHAIDSLSPTPLDPYNVQIGGASYANAAIGHMLHSLDEAAKGIEKTHGAEIFRAGQEIEFQHHHRMERNNEAMDRWREKAATDPMDQILSHAEAEGIMQVRAGIGRIGAIILLLANNPEIGAIEVSKATRPFCVRAHDLAKSALVSHFRRLEGYSGITDVEFNINVRPYKFVIEEHNGAFITKSSLGTVHANGTELEIVGRESGLLFDSEKVGKMPESQSKQFGPVAIDMAPLDMTSYARVKTKQ